MAYTLESVWNDTIRNVYSEEYEPIVKASGKWYLVARIVPLTAYEFDLILVNGDDMLHTNFQRDTEIKMITVAMAEEYSIITE
jgi:hypothetical protein